MALKQVNEVNSEIKNILDKFGFHEKDFRTAVFTRLERVIFLEKGLISDRLEPCLAYIPYSRIKSITKELVPRKFLGIPLKKRWMLAVKADVNSYKFANNNFTDKELKDIFEFDEGLIIFEGIPFDKLNWLENILGEFNLRLRMTRRKPEMKFTDLSRRDQIGLVVVIVSMLVLAFVAGAIFYGLYKSILAGDFAGVGIILGGFVLFVGVFLYHMMYGKK